MPNIEKYKSYNTNDYIPPLRQTFLSKITNYKNAMTPFRHCGIPFFRKLLIIQIQWLNSTTAVISYIEIYKSYNITDYIPPLRKTSHRKLEIILIQWLHSTSAVILYIEKYKSYNINDFIPPLRHDFSRKLQILKI